MTLTLEDLKFMENLIRICQSRGVFKPEEMIDVGTFFIRIMKEIETLNQEKNTEKK